MVASKEIDGVVYKINNNQTMASEAYLIESIETEKSDIVLPSTVDDKLVIGISVGVLHNNDKVKSITIPASYSYLFSSCFEGAKALEKVFFEPGSNIKSIPARAFWECKELSYIDLPDSITDIGVFAFKGCEKLKTFVCPESLEKIQIKAFKDSGIEIFTINKNLKAIATTLLDDTLCKEIVVNNENKNFYSINGVLFNDNHHLILYPPGKTKNKYTVPENTISITSYAFKNNFLRKVIIGNSVKEVEYNAFCRVPNLCSVVIASKNTQFNRNAFLGVPFGLKAKCPKNLVSLDVLKLDNIKVTTADDLTSFIDGLSNNQNNKEK